MQLVIPNLWDIGIMTKTKILHNMNDLDPVFQGHWGYEVDRGE